MAFRQVQSQIDFPALERELLDYWYSKGIVEKYLKRNKQSLPSGEGENSEKRFSFLDGPITANNPMGVHHAWGRTYKDVWQRFFNMAAYKQRFQNGFDEQGLWVEVEVEKELGLHNKKDIENLIPNDKFKSLEKFINLCKDRVKKYSSIQTEQSKRLGYFMDWDNSYHTSSDENNYAIWNFIKVVYDKGWLYKGHDSVPWCPRCGTAISQHEILTEEYKEIIHETVYFKLPISNKSKEYLLVWTTTPWTIPSNVAVAVNPKEEYIGLQVDGNTYWLMEKRLNDLTEAAILPKEAKLVGKRKGSELVGWEYSAPFDDLPLVKKLLEGYTHRVIDGGEVVTETEGTGLLHVAPGAGEEDFKLGKENKLPIISSIEEDASYLPEMGDFAGKNAKTHPEIIINFLENLDGGKYLLTTQKITHRYPTCWRCKTELVWRVVNEWYISMDKQDSSDKTYRQQMVEVAKKINWLPKWGLDRELDWLKNLHDWLISKKRYWGLSLPIWECKKCGNFEVIGSKLELKEKAVEGWSEFEGHSPHRPWVDQVKVKCSKCDEIISRIPDVGNPWLDAGIVPFSTLPKDWFPADFITESFPGQFKNWFYSLIAMSTALSNDIPFKTVLGFASVRDEKGEEMHKSKGNSLEFNEAADKMGADVMRWMYATANPENNLNFGYNVAGEVKRRFYLILWNCYKFFVDYANLDNWDCTDNENIKNELTVLDKWILARLTEVVLIVNNSITKYDAMTASRAIEDFIVNDFSTWFIRRSRDRVGPDADEKDRRVALSVMYGVLVTTAKLLAPFTPFIAEEIFRNLTGEESVHLQDYPVGDKALLNKDLIKQMKLLREIAAVGLSKRKEAEIKLRQPLASLTYKSSEKLSDDLERLLAEELNVKSIEYKKSSSVNVEVVLDTNITPVLAAEGEVRDLIREIQSLRKQLNLTLADKTKVELPSWPKEFETQILKATASVSLEKGLEIKVIKV